MKMSTAITAFWRPVNSLRDLLSSADVGAFSPHTSLKGLGRLSYGNPGAQRGVAQNLAARILDRHQATLTFEVKLAQAAHNFNPIVLREVCEIVIGSAPSGKDGDPSRLILRHAIPKIKSLYLSHKKRAEMVSAIMPMKREKDGNGLKYTDEVITLATLQYVLVFDKGSDEFRDALNKLAKINPELAECILCKAAGFGQFIKVGPFMVIPGVKNSGQLPSIIYLYDFGTNAEKAIVGLSAEDIEKIEQALTPFTAPDSKQAAELIKDANFKSAMRRNGLEHFFVATGDASIEQGVPFGDIWHIDHGYVACELDDAVPNYGLVLLMKR